MWIVCIYTQKGLAQPEDYIESEEDNLVKTELHEYIQNILDTKGIESKSSSLVSVSVILCCNANIIILSLLIIAYNICIVCWSILFF